MYYTPNFIGVVKKKKTMDFIIFIYLILQDSSEFLYTVWMENY